MKLFSKPDFTIASPGISAIERLTVGGIPQQILIQSVHPSNPVLLFIHGGPSMPVPGVCSRGRDYALVTNTKELVQHFTLVFWDQRGTGTSYSKHIPQETMRLEQFVQDALEVTDYLRQRFGKDKIHLAAHSWGTVIGLTLASRYSERYCSYTGFSQITNWAENDKLSYQWLLQKASKTGNSKALRELKELGEPPYTEGAKQWSVIRKWQFKFNTMFYNNNDKKSATFFSAFQIFLKSPDFTWRNIYNSLVRGFALAYTDKFVEDLNSFDFFTSAPALRIPVMFIHGSKEKHIMPELVIRYVEQLDAPQGKRLLWSPLSSHVFHYDDARENEQRLIEFVNHAEVIA